MTERDKEYYNQKISELYSIIENQEKIIRDLQEENIKLKDKLPIIIQANKCKWVLIEKWKDIVCVNYKILKGENNEKGSKR